MTTFKHSVLNISANDPLGLSGIQADSRAMSSMNVHCASIITATTAQTQHDFYDLNAVTKEAFKSQLDALYSQDIFSVIKVGLIADYNQAIILNEHALLKQKQIILDPVLAASSGSIAQLSDRIKAIKLLMPMLSMITPNHDEVLALVGVAIDSADSLKKAAHEFMKLGVGSVLIKGGHGTNVMSAINRADGCEDYFYSSSHCFYLSHDLHNREYSRGTGCILASLISSALAFGNSLADAVVMAKMQLDAGFRQRFKLDENSGSLQPPTWQDHLHFNGTQPLKIELPKVYGDAHEKSLIFQPCEKSLGLYPVVDRAHWLKTLLPMGIKIIQLRVKDLNGAALKNEIQEAINMARSFGVQLFINDYWQLAIECNAYGIHLGQEDIDDADLLAISAAGLRLGLSSHCFFEVARAKTINPSYIAFGPVYETQSKDMPWIPQGPAGLQYWRLHLPKTPLVAIGGIHGERFSDVKKTGVDAIAMISAITEHNNPQQAALYYKELFDSSD